MTKAEAVAKLRESFSRPCSTPDHGALDREQFLAKEREKLLALVIDPVEVKAVPSDWARRYAVLKNESYAMLAIAGHNQSWLLFDPSTKEYALAKGNPHFGEVELIGHSSTDALGEWRG